MLQIRFQGFLENGTPIADSQDRAFRFEVGAKQHVLEGIEVAVQSMCVGQRVEATIPALYGYGHQGFPPRIPPQATLVFKLELLGIEPKEQTKAE